MGEKRECRDSRLLFLLMVFIASWLIVECADIYESDKMKARLTALEAAQKTEQK